MEAVPVVGSAIEGLLNYIQPKDYRKRFLIVHRDGYKTVLAEDILYFYTELGISKAMLNTGVVENIPQTLEELENNWTLSLSSVPTGNLSST